MMRVVRLAGHVVASADSEGAVEYSYEELRKHASRESCWIAIDGGVYDVTGCIDDHPGGAEILLSMGGTDATGTFQALSKDAVLRRFVTSCSPALRDFVLSGDGYYAGKLVGAPVDPATADNLSGGAEDDSWIVAALRASGEDAALPTLDWEEITAHDNPGSLWVVVDGAVFDMTDFPDHPGGAEIPAEYGARATARPTLQHLGHPRPALAAAHPHHRRRQGRQRVLERHARPPEERLGPRHVAAAYRRAGRRPAAGRGAGADAAAAVRAAELVGFR